MQDEEIVNSLGREIVINMTNGNPGAMMVLSRLIDNPELFIYIPLLEQLNIKGRKLNALYGNCCSYNLDKFSKTLLLLSCGVFNEEEIDFNLSQVNAIPFIDDSIIFVNKEDEKWGEYCLKQRDSFLEKMSSLLEEEKVR